ncbi:MAG: type II toxin-antitoxin system PemK/MazF family toxin [Gemmatimonadaceae bacterium]|nr:type II toxin-antitoxin system PemK/MazF family toxin [Gloeobacterales cyanobacterium ES-bin-141]
MTGKTPQRSRPRQGGTYLCEGLKQQGDDKRRPVVIISENIRNDHSRTVLVVPITSDLDACKGNPARIFVSRGEGGLDKDSYISCDLISTVLVKNLVQGLFGSVSKAILTEMQ